MWPFCVQTDGKYYLHRDNWNAFKAQKEREYPHNWLHRRLFMELHSPANRIEDIQLPKRDDASWGIFRSFQNVSRIVNCVSDDWSVVFEPYPSYKFSDSQPSWHVYLEDKHPKPTLGDPVILFCTDHTLSPQGNIFASFRNQYWAVDSYWDYGLGAATPPDHQIYALGTKRRIFRSIDD